MPPGLTVCPMAFPTAFPGPSSWPEMLEKGVTMDSFRCDICGGEVFYDDARGYFHADPQKRNHLPFPVACIAEDEPSHQEATRQHSGIDGIKEAPVL
jgi:hypothetical protein